MKIWALADLHLSFGVKNKKMDVFGENWKDHDQKMAEHWDRLVNPEDLVLIAGDISWALHLEDALPDLEWIDRRPGTKVLIRGNHDLWWKSAGKVRNALPESVHIIHNDAYTFKNITIGGSRLWESPDINYNDHIIFNKIPEGVNVHKKEDSEEERKHDEKIFKNEIERLSWSLDAMDSSVDLRIVMVHYPPSGPEHHNTAVTRLLHNEEIDYCLYGHLHNLKEDAPVNYELGGTKYLCTATDYLNFTPLLIATLPIS